MPNTLFGTNISDTYQKLVQVENGQVSDGTGSLLPISFNGNDVTIIGTLHATSISSSRVTSSIIYTSGSSTFGDEATDTHTFLGSITASGNISSSGNVYGTNIYGVSTLRLQDASGLSRNVISNGSDDKRVEVGNVFMTSGVSLIGNVTASGNISSSGYIQTTELRGAGDGVTQLNVQGQITASGNITASQVYESTLYQWEATARSDTNDDTNWQGPNGYGIHTRADWNQDYGTDYDDPSSTNAESRLYMNTGWRIPNQANYSCSIKSMDVYVGHNTNDNHISASQNFSCTLWYSKNSDLTGEINVLGSSPGSFTQRHATTISSSQFKAPDEAFFKYNNYYVSASNMDLNLAPGSIIFPRIKSVGNLNPDRTNDPTPNQTGSVLNIHWIVNYAKTPL